MLPSSFNRVIIDLDALRQNFISLKSSAGRTAFLAMVKADGYGHGMVECARALEAWGCEVFGVAELREAVLLRESGIKGTIYAMIGFDPDDAELICKYDVTPVVYSLGSLHQLSQAAMNNSKEIEVHLKIDCGMSRLGVMDDEVEGFVAQIEKMEGLTFAGIASHLPCSDDVDSTSTVESLGVFRTALEEAGAQFPIVGHIANSGGILNFPETQCDMVRCGIAMYGYNPAGERLGNETGLRTVMSFVTQVLQVKTIPLGTGVSYSHTFTTNRETKLAVLPVGYEDGYSRLLSNCGEVLIHGRRAPVRGRVCMNLCMIDITDIEGVEQGDEVVLLGKQGEESITADEIASKIGTISYEVLCMIGNNNEREFI